MLPYDYRNALIISLAAMTICLSYVVITGFIGQVSLMQVALAGASGFVVSHLFKDAGIGFPLAAIAGTLAATVLGFVAGASALRVRGVSLAVVTLAAAVAIEQFGFANVDLGRRRDRLAGARAQARSASTLGRGPRSAGSTATCRARSSASSCCVVVVAIGLLVANVRRSRAGPADARGALQRARGGGRRHRRAQHEVRRLRDLVVHRRASAGRSTPTRWGR